LFYRTGTGPSATAHGNNYDSSGDLDYIKNQVLSYHMIPELISNIFLLFIFETSQKYFVKRIFC